MNSEDGYETAALEGYAGVYKKYEKLVEDSKTKENAKLRRILDRLLRQAIRNAKKKKKGGL